MGLTEQFFQWIDIFIPLPEESASGSIFLFFPIQQNNGRKLYQRGWYHLPSGHLSTNGKTLPNQNRTGQIIYDRRSMQNNDCVCVFLIGWIWLELQRKEIQEKKYPPLHYYMLGEAAGNSNSEMLLFYSKPPLFWSRDSEQNVCSLLNTSQGTHAHKVETHVHNILVCYAGESKYVLCGQGVCKQFMKLCSVCFL